MVLEVHVCLAQNSSGPNSDAGRAYRSVVTMAEQLDKSTPEEKWKSLLSADEVPLAVTLAQRRAAAPAPCCSALQLFEAPAASCVSRGIYA